MKRKVYAGLDLGTTVCEMVAIDARGKLLGREVFAPGERALRDAAARWEGDVHILLEECELAWWAFRCLEPGVAEVTVCDPTRNAWIFKDSVKSDKIDATKLAEIRRLDAFHPVFQPESEDMAAFKKVVTHYEEFTKKQASLKSQIKSRLRREGVIVKGKTPFSREGRGQYLREIPHPVSRGVVVDMLEYLDATIKAQEQARRRMLNLARRFPVVGLMRGVPGVGYMLSARFVAYIQTPHRFRSKRQLWRYSKLGITDRRSDGKPLGRKRLDRRGVGALKDLSRKVFDAAMRCRESNQFQRTFEGSQLRTGNPIHARLNTQRKILTVLWSMWRDGTEYQDDYEESKGLKDGRGAL